MFSHQLCTTPAYIVHRTIARFIMLRGYIAYSAVSYTHEARVRGGVAAAAAANVSLSFQYKIFSIKHQNSNSTSRYSIDVFVYCKMY